MSRRAALRLTPFQAAAVKAVTAATAQLPIADRRMSKHEREAVAWDEFRQLMPMLRIAIGMRWGIA